MGSKVYIGLGSNLEDRLQNLKNAAEWIGLSSKVLRASSVYETAPWGYTDQPAFLNQVMEVDTDMEPFPLLSYLKEGENKIGRKVNFRYGPRLIDMDILFYDQIIMETPVLSIPHHMINQRAFVLVPMVELEPDFIHPVNRQKLKDILAGLELSEIKKITA